MINLELHAEIAVSEGIKDSCSQFLSNDKYGFLNILKNDYSWEKLHSFKGEASDYKNIAIIGIGGSSQGAKSFLKYIDPESVDKSVLFFDRIDESYISNQLSKIPDLNSTAWFVISKSGRSTETLFILNTVLSKTEGAILNSGKLIVISESNESALSHWAQSNEVSVLPYPSGIEGRFSLFSLAGLLPLSTKIIDFEELKSAAEWVTQNTDVIERLTAFYLDSFQQGKWVSTFWLYSERLKEFGYWLEQLWAESLGKHSDEKRRVSTPFCCMGTNDQHSLLQQMEAGFADKSHLFLQIKKVNKNTKYNKNWVGDEASFLNEYDLDEVMNKYCESTYKSLNNHPSGILTLEDGSAKVAFQLHLIMALTIGSIGQHLGIEIYGQPGVEKSKSIFRELL